MIAPEVAFLLSRSIRTLVVQVRAQNATAMQVAEFLAAHPRVLRVNYPGLGGGSEVARNQMRGFGGMLSFVFDGSAEERSRRGIVDGMVRLSCGLEDAADLVDDLAQALS